MSKLKKWEIAILLFVSGFLLSGCSLLSREYSTVEEHSASYYESEEQSVLRAENQQEMVNDILLLIDDYLEKGTIWYYTSATTQEIEEIAASACEEIQRDTPLGAYAIEYITYDISKSNSNYYEVSIQLSYKKTEEDINSIVHTTSVAALEALLREETKKDSTGLVVQVNYFNNQKEEVEEVVERVQRELAQDQLWTIAFYPEGENSSIIEILFENLS